MSAEQEIPGSARSGEELDRPSEGVSPDAGGVVEHPDTAAATDSGAAPNMLPGRERRRFGLERILVRLIATFGIVAIGVAIAAIMVSSKSQGWIIGLVVSGVSVILSAILWSSRSV
jgi:hypothetical protein